MLLKSLHLQNFRNYIKSEFRFSNGLNCVIGANASGKSNLIEAIYMLSTGKSRRTDKDMYLINFGQDFFRIKGNISPGENSDDEHELLEVVLSNTGGARAQKRYFINSVPKRRAGFAGYITSVLFTPLDLEIPLGQPGNRRRFLDETLEQTDYIYREALLTYTKGLRQRNALLEQARETGLRDEKRFAYWDELLITKGNIITNKRNEFISYINSQKKELFNFELTYDSSEISGERLQKYSSAELGAGVTLVGPHRDDVIIRTYHQETGTMEDVKHFSSRGQQRLVVLELKLSQISYIKDKLRETPLLLLDDIFSELDEGHIDHVFNFLDGQQTILTTTHEDFIPPKLLSASNIIKF